MSKVRVGLSYTFQPVKFHSVKIDLAVEDVTKVGETTDECLERIYGYLSAKLTKKVQEEKKDLASDS